MAQGDVQRFTAYTALIEQLLAAGSRARRARIYTDAAVTLAGARIAVVAWRRRSAIRTVTYAEPGGPITKREYSKESVVYDGFPGTLELGEGEIADDAAWVPDEVCGQERVTMLLPEGMAAAAPRLFIAGADPDELDRLGALLRSLRPHWIEKRTLRRRATIDHLTGTYNFRCLRRYLKRRCARAHANGTTFSILMLDVDRLREYNAEFGHLMGSRVLAQLGRVLLRVIREGDFVAKYGGDEFLIVLQDATKVNAVDIALRFKDAISRQAFQGVPSGYITCSIGVATYGDDGTTFRSLVAAADRATYAAKDRGRNTVIAAGREKRTESRPSSR